MGYKYQVQVPNGYATKDHLALATDQISLNGRYINELGFELIFPTQKSESYIRSIFETVSIPVLSIGSSKTSILELEKAGGNDCESAQILCSNSSQTANSGGAGTQELNGTNQGCLSTEHQSSWYYLNIQTGGTLNMVIDPANNSDDYDFAIWGPFTAATANANCPPISAPIRCSYASGGGNTGLHFLGGGQTSEGVFGDGWVNQLTTSANQIYILLVDNFSNSGQPYNMSFGGTSVLGCTPVVLPSELTVFAGERTTKGNSLVWITESEHNTDYFNIEWSTNPSENKWSALGQITAAGESQVKSSYQFLHERPADNMINYYRLVTVDFNGVRNTHSDRMISISNTEEAKKVLKITNLLGQEVDEFSHGVLIYYYGDGTFQKVYK